MTMMIDPTGKPMMAVHEMGIVNGLLREHRCEVCLEFGSGNSTVYFPKEHRFIRQWVSVEHVGRYADYLKDKVDRDKVILIWVAEGSWYTDCVRYQHDKYDFVLIDGLFRDRCLEVSMKIVKEGGIILLHDSGRAEYRPLIGRYYHEVLCEGEQPVRGGFAHRGLTLFRR